MKRFLLIDENQENLYLIKGILGELRISDITLQEDSEEALSAIEAKRIECIISAWDNKKMSGKAFVQRVRAVPSQVYLPMIIYSQKIKGDEARLLKELGGISLIAAPIDRSIMANQIKKTIEIDEKMTQEERHLQQAYAMYGAKQWDEALGTLNQLTGLPQYKSEAAALVGAVMFEKGDYNASQMQIDECLAEKPYHTLATQVKARLSAKVGNHQEAIESLVRVLERNPEMLSILDSLGHAYKNANRLEEAKKTFQAILKIDKSSPSAASGLGEVAFMEGDYDLATELFQDAKNIDQIVRNLNNLGIALAAKGDFEKSFESYTNAIRIFAKSKSVYLIFYNLGLAYMKKGDLNAAYETLGQACLLEPTFKKSIAAFIKVTRSLAEKGMSYDKELAKKVKSVMKLDAAA